MLKRFFKMTAQGLLAALPLVVTLYVIWWIGAGVEKIFGRPLRWLIETLIGDYYVPGMGLVVGFILLTGLGLAAKLYVGQKLLNRGNEIIGKIPLAKTLYGSIRDFLGLFSGQKKAFSRVVLLTLPGSSQRLVGMVTREDFAPEEGFGSDVAAVYVPMSYQLGGYTLFVPKNSLETINMSVEEALRFTITAGVSAKSPAAADKPQAAPPAEGP